MKSIAQVQDKFYETKYIAPEPQPEPQPEPIPEPDTAGWKEMTGLRYCSGAGNIKMPQDGAPPGFRAGYDDGCPLVQPKWSRSVAIAGCKRLCDEVAGCTGFTFYLKEHSTAAGDHCCLRSGKMPGNTPSGGEATCYYKQV